jgi:chromosome segregation ATPase
VSEVDKLHDELERQSELIKALRNEIATKDKQIAELDQDLLEINRLLSEAGIEHSGYKKQAPRVEMLVERARKHAQLRIEEIKKRKALEAAQPDGRTYAEGCKP